MNGPLRQIAILLAVAIIPAAISAAFQWQRGNLEAFSNFSIPQAEVSQLKNPTLWVDARSVEDYTLGHIPGAVRLTEDNWNELLPGLLKLWEPDSSVIVYCDSQKCHASNEVAKRLREEVGLKNVYTLRGGWTAWEEAQR